MVILMVAFAGHWSGICLDRMTSEGFTTFTTTSVSRTCFLFVVFDAIQSEDLPTLHRQILGVSLICPYGK